MVLTCEGCCGAGLVSNLLDDVAMFGFVPNGGRLYYLNRSQPPLLADMVLALLDHDATLREGGQQKAKGNAI